MISTTKSKKTDTMGSRFFYLVDLSQDADRYDHEVSVLKQTIL